MDSSKPTTTSPPSPPKNLEFIYYNPDHQEPATKPRIPTQPKWRELAERIGMSKSFPRLGLEAFFEDDVPCNERPLDTALRLSQSIQNTHVSKDKRPICELLLLSLCSVLSISGRAAPEELDQVLKTIVKSSDPKYLDSIKRGARFSNVIIAEWAAKGVGTEQLEERLDRATQAVFQARLTISQWSTLSGYSSKVKEYITSLALPQTIPEYTPGNILTVPQIIQTLTNGSIKVPQLCECLGYTMAQASCMVGTSEAAADVSMRQ